MHRGGGGLEVLRSWGAERRVMRSRGGEVLTINFEDVNIVCPHELEHILQPCPLHRGVLGAQPGNVHLPCEPHRVEDQVREGVHPGHRFGAQEGVEGVGDGPRRRCTASSNESSPRLPTLITDGAPPALPAGVTRPKQSHCRKTEGAQERQGEEGALRK